MHQQLVILFALGLVICAGTLPGWDRGVRARGAARAGDRLYQKRDYRVALERYHESIARSTSGEVESLGRLWDQIAECAEKLGRYREALSARESALGLHLARDNRRAVAETLRRMGEVRAYLGGYDESLRILELAREVPHEGEDDRHKSAEWRALAVTYGALGRYSEQEMAANEALEFAREAKDPALEAQAWETLAQHRQSQGRFEDALGAANKALDATGRSNVPDRAPILLTLAEVHRARGDAREASKACEAALLAARESGVAEAVAVAQANVGLGAASFGEYARARQLLEEARTAFVACGASDDAARMELELGRISYHEQRYEEAMSRLERAKQAYETSRQPVAVAVVDAARGRVLDALGLSSEALGAHDRALTAYRHSGEQAGIAAETVERAMSLVALGRHAEALEAVGGVDPRRADSDVAWRIFQCRARVAASRGDIVQAAALYGDAAGAVERNVVRARLPELRASFLGGGDRLAVYDEAVELLARSGRAAQAIEFAERARARAFLDLLSAGGMDLRGGGDPRLLAREKVLKEQLVDLAQKAARRAAPPATGQLRATGGDLDGQLLAAREEYAALLEQLAASSSGSNSLLSLKPPSSATLLGALGPDEQLLEYHVGGRTVWAFLATRTSVAALPISTSPREIRSLASVLRIQLEQRIPSDRTARALHRLLIAPFSSRLRPGPLVVAPHDRLHYVPFQALIDEDGRYLIEQRPIRYVPSFAALAAMKARPANSTGGMLACAVGHPGPSVPSLLFATQEAQRVVSLYKGARVLLDGAATEAAFREAAPGASTLHMACHGVLDSELPLYSGLLLAPGGPDDGRLELHEIFNLKLHARIAVLSACRTGLGALSRGDELVCLSRAFLYAGCDRVVASLWSVPDQATPFLMERFHAGVASGLAADESLRRATLEMLAKPGWRDPFFWAPFCLSGSG